MLRLKVRIPLGFVVHSRRYPLSAVNGSSTQGVPRTSGLCRNRFPPFTFIWSSPPKTVDRLLRDKPRSVTRSMRTSAASPKTRMPAHHRRWRGRPRPSARRFGRTITQAEWVKELKRVSNALAEGTRSRLRRLRVARRLRGLLREPIQSRTGEAIHRRPGGASSQDWISGRAARVNAKHEMEFDERYVWD